MNVIINPERFEPAKGGLFHLVSGDRVEPSEFLRFYKGVIHETVYMGNVDDDGPQNVDQARGYLRALVDSDTILSMFCVQGQVEVVGRVDIILHEHLMARHRATISVSVLQDYQQLGIGTALMQRAMHLAVLNAKIEQFELTVYTDNYRAIGLYQKLGFRIIGELPNSAHTPDGRVLNEYIMVK